MQSDQDAERIIEIGAPRDRVVITGNLKFDRPAFDPTDEEIQSVRRSLGLGREQIVFVAGSTHGGEEEIILQTFRRLRRIESSLALILAPRHLERLGEVAEALDRSGFSWTRRSQVSGDGPPCEIVLLDTMGELDRIYSIGTVVFVGGSLVPVGGHNILEPAAFGKPVIFGPHMQNFREVAGIMKAEGGGIEVRNPEDLLDQAQRLLTDRSYHSQVSRAALQAIQKNQGATQRTLRIIERCLE
jgi:3-deoxy-D-manno-octulosonic-acid transferase